MRAVRTDPRRHAAGQASLVAVFRYAGNVADAVDWRAPEAKALAAWFDQRQISLGLPDHLDWAAPHAVSAASWRRLRGAIKRGGNVTLQTADSVEQWLECLASLRRFLVKLRFGWMTAAQARLAFVHFYGLPPPPGLDQLGTLTPADFALVARRAALMGEDGVAAALLCLLASECEGRDGGRTIGFQHPPFLS